MEELPVLDWLVVYLQPLRTELSVIQIDQRLSDEIIAKEIIVVVGRNLHRLSSWKRCAELVPLEESWVGLIDLVFVTAREDFPSTLDHNIRVRERSNISRRKIKALEKIQAHLHLLDIDQG